MTDLVFLKALRDKLKGGNTRSIHLNVLPGRFAARLDLGNLNYIKPNFAEEFLKMLLSDSSFEFKISFDGNDLNSLKSEEQKQLGLLSKRLNSIYIENDDNYKEHGIKTFGFGYPILIKPSKQDPKKIIKAPIFIWQLEIIKATNKLNTWSLLRNKLRNENGRIVDEGVHSVNLNEVLLSYLKSDENILIPQINEELLDDDVIDQTELIEQCYKVLKALNVNSKDNLKENLLTNSNESLKNIPEATTLESYSGKNPWIYFGGVFGLFRTQKESIITDLSKIIDNIDEYEFENLKVENYSGTALSAIETDPSQQEILSTLGIEPKKIIQGPPGTGKSQSLTALITNALSNNLKCLVVCEKKTALDVIKNNLQKENAQLASLAAIIEDIGKDRDGIINSVRERIMNLSQIKQFNNNNYSSAQKAVEEKAEELNIQHKQLGERIYQGKAWTELVGEFLKREKATNPDLLQSKLDYKEFRFNKDEYELSEIINKINIAKKLYAEVNRLDHPLEILNDKVFEENNSRAVLIKLENITQEASKNLEELKVELEKHLAEYQIWLDNHYSLYFSEIIKHIDYFKEFVKTNNNNFGDLFLKNDKISKFRILAFSMFSGKYKTLKENRQIFLEYIDGIKRSHQSLKYFNHEYIEDVNQISDRNEIIDNIEKLHNETDQWYNRNDKVKQTFIQNYSSENSHPIYQVNTSLKELEEKLNQIITNLNGEKILNTEFSFSKIVEQNIFMTEALISEMKTIAENFEDFREYFAWRKFYSQLIEIQRKVIRSLIEINCEDWVNAFESWYYNWLLSILESNMKELPKNEDKILELFNSKNQLKKVQIQSIIYNWSLKQDESVNRIKGVGLNPVSLYNKRGNKGVRRNSLRKIISADFQLFTDFFPVLMVSPTVCSSIIPLKEAIFDIVIFDEASQLRLEDTFPSLIRGKIKVVSGDSQQMPPSNYFQGGAALLNPTEDDYEEDEITVDSQNSTLKRDNSLDMAASESLLVYAENCGYNPSYLNVHYRSHHPQLIDFSNHAFYSKRLIPMPAKLEYKAIQFIEVNGLYKDYTNKDEARQVVDILLNHIKPFKNGNYPTIGIATFNIYQRNLILDEISKARQQKPEYDKKIADFGSSLFVKNLENIQGDERDIIIISTTFGKKSTGSFGQNFGPISNKSKGYKLLNVIITRAKYKIFVCSSIPNESILQYSHLIKNEFAGNGVFYSYLAYAKAISDGKIDIAQQVLNEIYESSPHKSFSTDGIDFGSESPFEEEVYYRLAEKIGIDRVQQQYKIGGFRIDLVIKSKITSRPLIAIECDGAKYHSSSEAYSWDMFRQTRLEEQGFIFYRIWSTNWWNSPAKELKKLVDFILKVDQNEKQNDNFQLEEALLVNEIIPVMEQTNMFR